jgi:hypothetical protein
MKYYKKQKNKCCGLMKMRSVIITIHLITAPFKEEMKDYENNFIAEIKRNP